jgi:hypothetical protein
MPANFHQKKTWIYRVLDTKMRHTLCHPLNSDYYLENLLNNLSAPMCYRISSMQNSHDNRRKINAELAVRGANKRLRNVIEKHTPPEEQGRLKIDFYCECSDDDCREHLSLTLAQYENLHDKKSQFVIAKGHQSPSVEKVIKTKHGLQVVEKYAL